MTRIKREIVQRGNLNPTFYELNIFTVYLIIKISRFKREKNGTEKWIRFKICFKKPQIFTRSQIFKDLKLYTLLIAFTRSFGKLKSI